MSNIPNLNHMHGQWLKGEGPHNEIVISSRVRLARNISGFAFVKHSTYDQNMEIVTRCKRDFNDSVFGKKMIWVDISDSPKQDRQLLVERHLISRQHAKDNPHCPRSVAIAEDESFSVMVNEEDHLRIQVMRSGLQLRDAFDEVNHIDDTFEGQLEFAFSSRFGYLTACPTNVGTGIRVSVMMHLPALKLTGEIEKVRKAARDMNLAVRGLFGEGSESLGDFYQVSNQATLGRSEAEILDDFERSIVPQIVAYEQQAREALLRHRSCMLDDKIFRAWGALTHARVIGAEEVLTHLSHLRLGVNMGRIDTVSMATINELLLNTQPAHLQWISAKEMSPAARREARATLIREKLLSK